MASNRLQRRRARNGVAALTQWKAVQRLTRTSRRVRHPGRLPAAAEVLCELTIVYVLDPTDAKRPRLSEAEVAELAATATA